MMIRCMIAVLLVGGTAALAQPSATKKTAGQPKIVCPDPVLDLGTIIQGKSASGTFTIQNKGDAVLEIKRIKPDCGCTTVALADDQKKIPPGGEIELTVKFNSQGRRGKQKKHINVFTNDPTKQSFRVTIECVVEAMINARPSTFLSFEEARRGEAIKKTVDLIPGAGAKTLTITSLSVKGDGILCTHEPLSINGKQGVQLRFAVEDDAPLGGVNASVQIQAKADDQEATETIRLAGEIIGELRYWPSVITLRRPAQRGHELRSINVQSNSGKPFQILGVDAGPNLVTDVVNAKDGTEYELKLTVSEKAPDGPFGVFVDIRTSVPAQPLVRVPVFVAVSPSVVVSPPLVLLKDDNASAREPQHIRVSSARGTSLAITGVTTSQPFVVAEVADGLNKRARKHKVRIALAGKVPPGMLEAVVTLETDVKGAERVEVPVIIMTGKDDAVSGQ